MLVATGHALYARERVPERQEGYEFSVLGDFDANALKNRCRTGQTKRVGDAEFVALRAHSRESGLPEAFVHDGHDHHIEGR
jgi:hypothetical protein